MGMKANIDPRQQVVSEKAQAVFDILVRTGGLPDDLSLSIEEILERAWEIAYHRPANPADPKIVPLARFSARRRMRGDLPLTH